MAGLIKEIMIITFLKELVSETSTKTIIFFARPDFKVYI